MKTWVNSQKYELDHAKKFMSSKDFVKLIAKHRSGMLKSSNGYVNPSILKEFFCNDVNKWKKFLDHIFGKIVLEVGPCIYSFLSDLDGPKEKIIIEPLFSEIDQWQKEKFGFSTFENLKCNSIAGDIFIKEYSRTIDGAIFCRNMLDHTPEWPFVLANISNYAAKGCKLLLWTDIHHGTNADEGHYNITKNKAAFERLISELGFHIIRTYEDTNRQKINYGCYAVKK